MTPVPANPSSLPPAASGFTTYDSSDLTEALVAGLAAAVCRISGSSLPRARALVGWAQTVIVQRDARGAISGVHAFRFENLTIGEGSCHLVYDILAAVPPALHNREVVIRQVGTQVYRRQRQAYPKTPIVWVNGPGCDAGTPFPVDTENPARRLAIRADAPLPLNIHFHTDQPVGEGLGGTVPPAIETATARLIDEQRSLETRARFAGTSGYTGLRRAAIGLTAATGIAAAFLFFARPHPGADLPESSPATRLKGSSSLRVFRQTGSGSEELISGAHIAPGDHVRFAVDVPAPRHVRVIGLQENGELYTAWPPPGEAVNEVIPAGTGKDLPGAVAFDGTAGKERLYLVSCPAEMSAPTCTAHGANAEPACPAGCTLTPFSIEKGN
jgi:hypothetical protein